MKFMRMFPILTVALSFVAATCFYPIMPQLMASHWGINGQVDGYVSKTFGLFFLPCLLAVMYIMFLVLPKTDPYHKNFTQFKKYFDNFVNIIIGFLFYIYLLTIVWNLGHKFNMIQLMTPAMSAIFYYAGVLMSVARRNWFVGIRTPWTMSSDLVWDKTHRLGSRLFKATALIGLLGIFLPHLAIYLILIPILASTVLVFIYSYFEYSKLHR